jgi:hypothetical protein
VTPENKNENNFQFVQDESKDLISLAKNRKSLG